MNKNKVEEKDKKKRKIEEKGGKYGKRFRYRNELFD